MADQSATREPNKSHHIPVSLSKDGLALPFQQSGSASSSESAGTASAASSASGQFIDAISQIRTLSVPDGFKFLESYLSKDRFTAGNYSDAFLIRTWAQKAIEGGEDPGRLVQTLGKGASQSVMMAVNSALNNLAYVTLRDLAFRSPDSDIATNDTDEFETVRSARLQKLALENVDRAVSELASLDLESRKKLFFRILGESEGPSEASSLLPKLKELGIKLSDFPFSLLQSFAHSEPALLKQFSPDQFSFLGPPQRIALLGEFARNAQPEDVVHGLSLASDERTTRAFIKSLSSTESLEAAWETLKERGNEKALADVVGALSNLNPTRALDLARSLPDSRASETTVLLTLAGVSLSRALEEAASHGITLSEPELRGIQIAAIKSGKLTDGEVQRITESLESASSSNNSGGAATLTQELGRKCETAESALAAASKFQSDDLKQSFLEAAAESLMRVSAAEASEIMSKMIPPPSDNTIVKFLQEIPDDPGTARTWAGKIKDPGLREAALHSIPN